jgi:predicted PurR-regulated permease PerM
VRVLPSERLLSDTPQGTPVPDSKAELPPVIRRAELVAFALVALLIICVVAVLYVAKAFFLPIVMAFIVGTMLSPAASLLERYRIPRPVGAVLIVTAVGAAVAFMVGLISAPLMEWSSRLPELGAILKDKLHVFDRPLALWQELQSMVGGPDTLATFQMPKFEWVQPALEFLSPTFAEFLLFIAILILFIASWKDSRRALIMIFGDRTARLRALRIINEIEEHLGNYLLMVTMINTGVGVVTGIICALTGMPNPAGLGALAATLNFLEGHFITPTIVGRRLELNALAVFMALAFWTWLWGPMGAFLSSPLLIVALILKEHLTPVDSPQLPED